MEKIQVQEDRKIYSEELHSGHIVISNSAHLDVFVAGLSGDNAEIIIDLIDEGSSVDFNLIAIANNEEKNIKVTINNFAKNTKANMTLKGISQNNGICNINATGHIAKECSESENFQESRVLLLDQASRGEASPLLLIENYDVKAGHSASVSRVDSESIYYLQTRGIDKIAAEKILTKAFFQPFIDKADVEELEGKIWTI